MFANHVVALLRSILPPHSPRATRYYHIAGVGESHVEEAIGDQLLAIPDIELGYCAKAGEVTVRITADSTAIELADAIVQQRFGNAIFARDETSLEQVVVALLAEQEGTLAVAESCTGGLLASRVTDVPGASAVFLAGYVTYSNDAKTDLLGVRRELIEQHGAVSGEVARAMAEGARTRAHTTFGIGITGIAGPSGGSDEKPVGTVFIALAAADRRTIVLRERLPSDRATFKQLATQTALEMLRRQLLRQRDRSAVSSSRRTQAARQT